MTKLTEIVIRVVGSWNTKIFTPIWISETLLNFNIKDSLEIVFNKELKQEYYNRINSIPTNFLIDGNGVILAKGLRGEQLPQALATQVIQKKKGKSKKEEN